MNKRKIQINTLRWALKVIKEERGIMHPYWRIEKRMLLLQRKERNARKKL